MLRRGAYTSVQWHRLTPAQHPSQGGCGQRGFSLPPLTLPGVHIPGCQSVLSPVANVREEGKEQTGFVLKGKNPPRRTPKQMERNRRFEVTMLS